MKSIFLAATALALALPACAQAQDDWEKILHAYPGPYVHILPPVEYDHAFPGEVIVVRESEARMKGLCPKTVFPTTLACSQHFNDGKACVVVIGDDKLIAKVLWTYEVILRHEIGHCNGWPGDHRGARPLIAIRAPEGLPVPQMKKPASILPSYPVPERGQWPSDFRGKFKNMTEAEMQEMYEKEAGISLRKKYFGNMTDEQIGERIVVEAFADWVGKPVCLKPDGTVEMCESRHR